MLTGEPSPRDESGVIGRVEVPTVTEPPEAVADLEKERAAAKKATEEKAATDKKAEEEKAAKKESEEEAKPPPPDDPTLYLTVPKLGVYGHTVRNDTSAWALDQGAVKLPSTGFPWQDNANTYIAGHRIGYAGTESYYQFYNLPLMKKGDEVILEDANGTVYKYRVSEMFAVRPTETWVTNPVPGRDMVTLQTCVEDVDPGTWWNISPKLLAAGPDTGRLIVRAERVE
jgi:sortase A